MLIGKCHVFNVFIYFFNLGFQMLANPLCLVKCPMPNLRLLTIRVSFLLYSIMMFVKIQIDFCAISMLEFPHSVSAVYNSQQR